MRRGAQEALWRAAAFADAGADVLFIDALASVEEMAAFCALPGAAARLPKMANMLEGGGKTPILPPEQARGAARGLSLSPFCCFFSFFMGCPLKTTLADPFKPLKIPL